jgi:hypothetical protein
MDYLVMENFLLSKKQQPQGLLPGLEKYRRELQLD